MAKMKRQAEESKLKKMVNYDPYKVFDSRRGCVMAVALSIFLVMVSILNAIMNSAWLSLIFVPFYLLIIRNRLRRLRTMS
jgi:hypothetical protein